MQNTFLPPVHHIRSSPIDNHSSIQRLPYTAMEFCLTHKERAFHFSLPADPSAILDRIDHCSSMVTDRYVPYWAENWPSAAPFFSFLADYPFPQSSHFLELGSGLGVLSSILSHRHYLTVSIDFSFESCCFATHNITTAGGCPRTICSDWRHLPLKVPFDYIIASDILYEKQCIEAVLETIEEFLSPDGTALIADPCRRYWDLFKTAASRSFFLTIVDKTAIQPSGMVEIISLQRN